MKKALNFALLVSFILTILVPLTGVYVHKIASALFLVLTAIHTVSYRKKLGTKRWLMLALVVAAFISGMLGMILDQYPVVLILHRVISVAVVFFAAIHIFVFHRAMFCRTVRG